MDERDTGGEDIRARLAQIESRLSMIESRSESDPRADDTGGQTESTDPLRSIAEDWPDFRQDVRGILDAIVELQDVVSRGAR